MVDWHDFETVFQPKTDYTLDHKQIEAIIRHRKELGGQLFFDRIWTSLGLKQSAKHYPPKSNQELKNLWQKVVQSQAADEQKNAILYYLLRDCRQLHNADTTYARKVYLPAKYQLLITGLWELDHCQFTRAIEHLTDPSLSPTFTDEILLALLNHSKCDISLAMAYYIAVSPPLRSRETLHAYFNLLMQTNIVQAYRFCRSRERKEHKELFHALISFVHEQNFGPESAKVAVPLISLPFSPDEEKWFENYLLRGDGSSFEHGTTSVVMRRIVQSRSVDGLNKELNIAQRGESPGVAWDSIFSSLRADDCLRLTLQQLAQINANYPGPGPVFNTSSGTTSGAYWRPASDAYGELRYRCPGLFISAVYATANISSWAYQYNVTDPTQVAEGEGVPHTVEVNSIWGPENTGGGSPKSYYPGGVNAAIVPVMQGYWTSFVKYLDPSVGRFGGTPVWGQFSGSSGAGDQDGKVVIVLQTNSTHMASFDELTPLGLTDRCAYFYGIAESIGQ